MLKVEDCKPGTPVECIDASPSRWPGDTHELVHGAIYTIKRTRLDVGFDGSEDIAVDLVEHSDADGSFDRDRFRLLPDSRLEVFRAMLAPKPAEREAELLRAMSVDSRDPTT